MIYSKKPSDNKIYDIKIQNIINYIENKFLNHPFGKNTIQSWDVAWTEAHSPTVFESTVISQWQGAKLGQSYSYDMALAIIFLMNCQKDFFVNNTIIHRLTQTLSNVIENGIVPFSYIIYPDNVIEKSGNFTGASAWVGLALAKYANKYNNEIILNKSKEIFDYIINNHKTDLGNGMLVSGGVGKTWFSTEHNIDMWNFANFLYFTTRESIYKSYRDKLKISIMQYMWNDTKGTFDRGKDDTVDALDCSTWGSAFLTITNENTKAQRAIDYASNNATTSANYPLIEGYNRGEEDFNGNHVWVEGTFGFIYANIMLGNQNTDTTSIELSNVDGGGYLYCTDTYEIIDDSMLRAPAIGSTAWAGLTYTALKYNNCNGLWINEDYSESGLIPLEENKNYKYNYLLIVDTEPQKYFATGKLNLTISGTNYITTEKTMEVPSGLTQTVDFASGKSTIGSIKVRVHNKDEDVSKWIYFNMQGIKSIYKKRCTLYFYEENVFDSNDKRTIKLYTGELRSHNAVDEYETSYNFEIADIQDSLKESAFIDNGDGNFNFYFKKCKFYGTGAVNAYVDRPAGMGKAIRLKEGKGISDSASGYSGYINLNNGFFIVDTLNTSVDGSVVLANRARMNLVSQLDVETAYNISMIPSNDSHPTESNAFWNMANYVIFFKGHPIDLATLILTDMDIPFKAYSFAAVKAFKNHANYLKFYWEFKDKLENPLDFIQKEIYSVCNCFPIINADGEIELLIQQQPTVLELQTGLIVSHKNTLNMPKLAIDYSQVKNNIKFVTQYDFYDSDYKRTDMYVDSESFQKFGRLLPKKSEEMELQGLNAIGGLIDSDISQITGEISSITFDKFRKEVVSIECEVFYSDICDGDGNFVRVGDYISFYHKNVMEWRGTQAGTRGISDTSASFVVYAEITVDEWGNYTDNLEVNNGIMLLNGTKENLNVARVIEFNFFTGDQSLEYSYNISVDWLIDQGAV
jgi:hypothetical protein